jgi:hypothetical protein
MGIFSFNRQNSTISDHFRYKISQKRKKTPSGVLNAYRIIAIKPPDPSLIILSNVSFNLYLAFSGIRESFA